MQFEARNWKQVAAVCAVTLAMAVTGWAQAADRITQELGTGGVVTLHGSVHRLVRRSIDEGKVNPAMPLNSLTMHFGLSAEQQIDMDALTAAQQDPKSPQYHQWLTQEQYAARFGMTDADLAKVTQWLKVQGFAVHGISKSRNAIHFGGKASQVESAFHTQLHRYRLNGEMHFANATDLQIPAELRGVLLVVRGLNDFRPKPQLQRAAAVADFTLSSTQHFLAPGDWATIYNVNGIYNAGYTGTGTYVGVVGQTYAPQPDIDHFRSAAGLSATKLTYVCIDPTAADCTGTSAISTAGDLSEADLDIEWAGGIAKNATVVYVYAPWGDVPTNPIYSNSIPPIDQITGQYYDVFDALDHAVYDYTNPATGKVLPVISMSYTDCEQDLNAGYVTWITDMGQAANSLGQTIVVASGDTGAAGCDWGDYPAQYGVSASVPVDSPNYTGVGGTVLSGDESYPSQYWNQTVNQVNTALSYIPETVWNDTTPYPLPSGYETPPQCITDNVPCATLSTPGGGVSLNPSTNPPYFAQPTWQPTPLNYSGPAGRFVPDVAFAASADHDGYMYCSSDDNSPTYGTMCANGFFSSGDGTLGTEVFFPVGGTSAATPSFAGMLTLLDQKYGPQGNLNPTLYQMAANSTTYASVFHDITSGENMVPCEPLVIDSTDTGCVGGSSSPGDYGTMGYSATSGYDLTTGLGSIDGGALMAAMATGGTAATAAATTTNLTVSPTSAQLGSTTVTLTATVASAVAGTIDGQVTFSVNGTSLGTAQLSSGTAMLNNVLVSSTHGFTGGANTISADFSGGDSYFAASSTTASLEVSSSTDPPLAMTASASTVSLQPGGSANVTLNLNSTTYAGTVTFNVSTTSSMIMASTPVQVAMTIGGNGSTTLTVTASQSASQRTPVLPCKTGGVIFFAALVASPFALRKRSAIAVLLLGLAILPFGLLTSCGGGGSSGSSSSTVSYVVTVTPTLTPATTKLSPVRITVNVQ